MDRQRGIIIQGLDILDVISFNSKKTKRFQAEFLQELETILDPKSKEFKETRKLYLDNTNENMRSVFRSIFGDIEYLAEKYE